MNDPPDILSLEHVAMKSEPPYESGMWDVSLSLEPRDLVLVRLEKERVRIPLMDAASGLLDPEEGRLLFLGEAWDRMSRDVMCRQRAKIGRVFSDGGWISSLDVDENIMLAQRHHSGRPYQAIMDEAAGLARMFGLPGLPRGPVARARRQDLRVAACVRAFLGNPILLLLEGPTAGMHSELMPGLMRAIRGARDRGAAVLWLTDDFEVWNDHGIRPTSRYLMSGCQFLACER